MEEAREWSLRYPEKYRANFMRYYEQWKDTDRPEGALWWARVEFGEYCYPGWGNFLLGPSENQWLALLER